MTGVRKKTWNRTRSRLSRVNPDTAHNISNTLLCYKGATLCNPRTWASVLEWKALLAILVTRDCRQRDSGTCGRTGCRILSQNRS
ncbi:hypothetical protein C5615_11705 [Burkholderia cepacia]|uniref:Uncharacterized protein n=1 Tax=Burkholderia cepacia TaxID=292 RepID=A0A2S8IVN8_BURCE|nr:hypothetical protein C5615_11705 [Burkholderia cepacia]